MIRNLILILIAASLASGCAPYAHVQSQLVDQAARGVAALEQSLEQKSQIVAQHHALRRQQLDAAFDADVSQRDPSKLGAGWVIEHRRAYAAALDALSAARLASVQADEADRRNAQATLEALDRLRWLQSLQLRLVSFGRENANERD
jgi:hypothetical protein